MTKTAQDFQVLLDGNEVNSASLSEDGCNFQFTNNAYWEAGNEPWKDERDFDLQVVGETLSGTMIYGCHWCPSMDMTYTYDVSGTRTQ